MIVHVQSMACRLHTLITLYVHPGFPYWVLGVTIKPITHSLSFFFSFLSEPICRAHGAEALIASMGTLVSMWIWLVVIGLLTLAVALVIIYRCMIVCYLDTPGESSE